MEGETKDGTQMTTIPSALSGNQYRILINSNRVALSQQCVPLALRGNISMRYPGIPSTSEARLAAAIITARENIDKTDLKALKDY